MAGPSDSGDAKIRESYELCKRSGSPNPSKGLADGEILWMAQMFSKCSASDKLLSELKISRSEVQPPTNFSASAYEPPPKSYGYSHSSGLTPRSGMPEPSSRAEVREK